MSKDIKEKISKILDFSKVDSKVLKNKSFVKIVGGVCVLIVMYGVITLRGKDKDKKLDEAKLKDDGLVKIKTATDALNTDQVWRLNLEEKLEGKGEEIGISVKKLEEKISLAEENFRQQIKHLEEGSDKALKERDNYYQEKIKFLMAELSEQKLPASNIGEGGAPNQPSNSISVTKFERSQITKPDKTIENYIPAGTFAKGILLSGIDASTALNRSNDPEPILLKIVDEGTLPRRFKSDLKECHVVASTFGDLSSERAKIRLETLSCIEIKTGKVIETAIGGYVTGGDSKLGIRGDVASKEGKFIFNSFMGGALGGLASSASKRPGMPSLFASGDQKAPGFGSNIRDGLLDGSTTSMDRLSKYYIDRAEQIQPIIQVDGGQVVNIVFTKGSYIGETISDKQSKPKTSHSESSDQEYLGTLGKKINIQQ